MPERVVVSGVDGGLLDPRTGDWDGARPALATLARLRVPLVLCSSRPRAELALLSRLWGLDAPMIVENGAALLVPAGHLARGVPGTPCDGELHVLTLGPGRQALREELLSAARSAALTVSLLSDLTGPDRLRRSGPESLTAGSAPGYEHSEPFLVDHESDLAALEREVVRRGLRIFRGPRFWHLSGGADKGLAVRTLLALYEREGPLPRAIGLGAWPTDIPMLRSVHRAVLMPASDGGVHAELAAAFPRARRAAQAGPPGWSEAVLLALASSEPARAPDALARIA